MTLKNRYFLLIIGILIITGIVVVSVIKHYAKPPTFDEAVKEVVVNFNKKRMTKIDEETRLDSVEVLPIKLFQYNSTLINHDSTTLNIRGLKKDVYPVLLKRVKTDPELQILRNHKASVNFRYRDKNGHLLFEILITPEQYSQ